jgi:FkbM family methyltransferase
VIASCNSDIALPVPPSYLLARNKYGVYCIPAAAAHRPAARFVLAGRIWEEDTVQFLVERCKTGGIVTAGAFFGDFLPALSAAVSADSQIWAFEPNPESFHCCATTIQLNRLSNVLLTNSALGERPETANLVVTDPSGSALGGASYLELPGGSERESGVVAVPVSVVAIDDLVPGAAEISILQLDVEGSEESALAGAANTIERCRPLLVLETLPPPDSRVGRFLKSLNYRFTRRVSSNAVIECA